MKLEILIFEFLVRLIPFSEKQKRKIRRNFYSKLALKKVKDAKGPIYVNRYCNFNKKTTLGSNVHFNGLVIAGKGKVVIGNNFHSGVDCRFITQNHNYQGEALPYDKEYIYKDIIIEDNVWLGDRVIVLNGVTIGEGAIIQAGSVVVSDIPKCGIAGGHPAKVFKYRNRERYERLKAAGKFQ